jgi:hypothetical protein
MAALSGDSGDPVRGNTKVSPTADVVTFRTCGGNDYYGE